MSPYFDNFNIEHMSKEEHEKKQNYVLSLCNCKDCGSYVEGDENDAFCFPLYGTSSVIKKEVECRCDSCSIYEEYDLNHTYYCTRCSQLCQSYKTEIGFE